MKKQNALLARLEAGYAAKYAAMRHMMLQMSYDAACIAAHEVLQMGPGRADKFKEVYQAAINEIAGMVVEDGRYDKEITYAKEKLDQRIRPIVGEQNFVPWDERYKP